MLKDDFTKVYYILSFFYLLYFYILPLIIVTYKCDEITLDILKCSYNDLILAYYSLLIFILGFISVDIVRFLVIKKKRIRLHIRRYRLSIIFWIILYLFILFSLIQSFMFNNAEILHLVRKGEIKGSWLNFFIQNVLLATKFALIFIMLNKVRRIYIVLFLAFIIVTDIVLLSGRFNFLIDILIIIMVVTNVSALYMSIYIYILIIISLPFVFYLKNIIYMLAIGDFNISKIEWSLNLDMYLLNFSHPVISLININSLIEQVGFRYGYDYIHGFLFYLKIIGLDFGASLTYYNTYNLIGKFESIIPPGYLAFGYVQLSYLGVFISGLFYRLLGSLAYFVYKKTNPFSETVKFIFAFITANSFYHGEIRIIILTILFPFFSILILSKLFKKE